MPTNVDSVFLARLSESHQDCSFTRYKPLPEKLRREIDHAVRRIFDHFGGKSLLKSSGDVYLKPNAVTDRPYSFTRTEVLESVIRYWKKMGARNVIVMENCTQCTCTRLVFANNGYARVCKSTGAIPRYLDEDKQVTLQFRERNINDYDSNRFVTANTVYEELIQGRDRNLYIDLPKLKTHSMSVVTLGIKNQWCFPMHEDRIADHNYNLHNKLVDVLARIRPDFTLIEGVEGTIYGHIPVMRWADHCVLPFKVLVGGPNVVATDAIGARIFGYDISAVPHIAGAIDRGLGDGVSETSAIPLAGDIASADDLDLLDEHTRYGGQYPFDLPRIMPETVITVKGTEMACREGCVNNVLGIIQHLFYDHDGKGGFTVVMGKGFDTDRIDRIKGRVLLAGHCAIDEMGERLVRRLGVNNVYKTGGCNDLQASLQSLCHLMNVRPASIVKHIRKANEESGNFIDGWLAIHRATRNKSTARMIRFDSHRVKHN